MSAPNMKIQEILDRHVAKGVVGCSLAISIPGQGFATYTSGYADKFKKTPMRPDHIFRHRQLHQDFHRHGTSSPGR